MKTVLSFAPKGVICFLEICAKRVTVATMYSAKLPHPLPFIAITYSLEDLAMVAPLTKAMHGRHILPEVYIWDEDKAEPEVLVRFHVDRPSWKLVRKALRFADQDALRQLAQNERLATMFTTAEANIDRSAVQGFLASFETANLAAITISEQEGDLDPTELKPLDAMMIYNLHRGPPDAVKMLYG